MFPCSFEQVLGHLDEFLWNKVILTHWSTVPHSCRNQSVFLHCKSKYWFQHEIQHGSQMIYHMLNCFSPEDFAVFIIKVDS